MNDSRSGFGGLHMPRSRGAVSGLLLIILGVWGALIPFIGPYFHFAYTPDQAWVWSTGRAWLEVFPGLVTAAGGFLLLVSGNRATAMFSGWLAVIAGIADRGHRAADRRNRCQACRAGDLLFLRAGRTDRVPEWRGVGAGNRPHVA
jgi:hypothetical protein